MEQILSLIQDLLINHFRLQKLQNGLEAYDYLEDKAYMRNFKISCPFTLFCQHYPFSLLQNHLQHNTLLASSAFSQVTQTSDKLLRTQNGGMAEFGMGRSCHAHFSSHSLLKPRPNDRNMPTLHIGTLLGETCCVRLATVLQHVGCCGLNLKMVKVEPTIPHMSQHVATRSPKAHNMLRYVAFACCDRLGGA